MIRGDRVPGTVKPRTGAARQPALAVLAALLAMTLSGCITSSASPSAVESGTASPSAALTPTPTPTPTPEPMPSFLTAGYTDRHDAIKAWVEGTLGDPYVGDCRSATVEDAGACSLDDPTDETVTHIGLVMSEPAWTLRLEKFGDLWYVAEATYAPPPF